MKRYSFAAAIAVLVCLACDHATPVQPVPPPVPPPAAPPPAPPPPPSPAAIKILTPSIDTATFLGDSVAFSFRMQDANGHDIVSPFTLTLSDSTVLKVVPASSARLFWMRGQKAGQTVAKVSAGNVSDSVRIAVAEHQRPLADYDVIDLGTLGGTSALPLALNDDGQIVGWSLTVGGERHAFLWSNGTMHDLAPDLHVSEATSIANSGVIGIVQLPEPGNAGYALHVWSNDVRTRVGAGDPAGIVAVGDSGEVVGWESDGEHDRSFIWRNGGRQALGGMFPNGPSNVSSAQAMNRRGQIVGSAAVREYAGSEIPHAFSWENGIMRDLGLLGGHPCPDVPPTVDCSTAAGFALNNQGAVVGFSSDSGGHFKAVLWANDTIHDLGPGRAIAINDAGDIVAYTGEVPTAAYVAGDNAIFWHGGTSVSLGSLGGGGTTVGGLNTTGLVAGSSLTATGVRHVFVWDPQGNMTDLGSGTVTTAAAGAYAVAINTRGDILGFSYVSDCVFEFNRCFGARVDPVVTRAILWRRKN